MTIQGFEYYMKYCKNCGKIFYTDSKKGKRICSRCTKDMKTKLRLAGIKERVMKLNKFKDSK